MVAAQLRLPADHAVDHLIDLLEQVFPNRIPSPATTESLLKAAGHKEIIDFLRSLQHDRNQNLLKE